MSACMQMVLLNNFELQTNKFLFCIWFYMLWLRLVNCKLVIRYYKLQTFDSLLWVKPLLIIPAMTKL